MYYIIIFLFLILGIVSLWKAFSKGKTTIMEECEDAYDDLLERIGKCQNHKELGKAEDSVDDFYDYYVNKIDGTTLNGLFGRLNSALNYKRVNL
ncbi:hypothetical protein [Paraflavitalea sp. CAU 1676]|uniref:hypothetical protein n=1 Tax=Paraflavitalea sp. CAU 1676 TaxID=3032598 RepID=UPI0023DA4A96|nr:hypothetical protein [Paraflavitalea sp. CAU 1676]MDF2189325.1 hypothetical protein [Paraflavitalea sp. CAU 1676]